MNTTRFARVARSPLLWGSGMGLVLGAVIGIGHVFLGPGRQYTIADSTAKFRQESASFDKGDQAGWLLVLDSAIEQRDFVSAVSLLGEIEDQKQRAACIEHFAEAFLSESKSFESKAASRQSNEVPNTRVFGLAAPVLLKAFGESAFDAAPETHRSFIATKLQAGPSAGDAGEKRAIVAKEEPPIDTEKHNETVVVPSLPDYAGLLENAVRLAKGLTDSTEKVSALVSLAKAQHLISSTSPTPKQTFEAARATMLKVQANERKNAAWRRMSGSLSVVLGWMGTLGIGGFALAIFGQVFSYYLVRYVARLVGDEDLAKHLGATIRTVKKTSLILPDEYSAKREQNSLS